MTGKGSSGALIQHINSTMKRGIDMKKSTMLAFTAAVLLSAASFTGHAASAPTYDDNLILPNPASATWFEQCVCTVASPQ